MRRCAWALALLWGAACGPPGPKPSEGVILHTRTSGEVAGAGFGSPIALSDTFNGRTRLLITDESNACSSLDVGENRPVVRDFRGAIRPSLLLVVAPTPGVDQRVTAGVSANFDPGGPADAGPAVCMPVADAGPDAGSDGGCTTRVRPATGGFVHLLEARDGGPTELEGVFDTVYAEGRLNGGFRAVACPKLHQTPENTLNLGCQSVAGPGLWPLLALGLLRRRARR